MKKIYELNMIREIKEEYIFLQGMIPLKKKYKNFDLQKLHLHYFRFIHFVFFFFFIIPSKFHKTLYMMLGNIQWL